MLIAIFVQQPGRISTRQDRLWSECYLRDGVSLIDCRKSEVMLHLYRSSIRCRLEEQLSYQLWFNPSNGWWPLNNGCPAVARPFIDSFKISGSSFFEESSIEHQNSIQAEEFCIWVERLQKWTHQHRKTLGATGTRPTRCLASLLSVGFFTKISSLSWMLQAPAGPCDRPSWCRLGREDLDLVPSRWNVMNALWFLAVFWRQEAEAS